MFMQTDSTDVESLRFDQLTGVNGGGQGRGTSLSDLVYERLFQCISSGQYARETKLPSENELARSFDVSRPVVRDALKRLREDGIIYSRQGAGSFVLGQGGEKHILEADGKGIGVFRPAETIADIQRCFEFREAIETQTAQFAAQRRNVAVLDELEAIVRRLERATANHTHRDDIDFEFHLAIARASNNQYFSTVLAALRDQVAVGMRLHGMALLSPEGKLEETTDEHRAILNAIRAGDAAKAGQLMGAHIRNSRDRLFGGSTMDLRLRDD